MPSTDLKISLRAMATEARALLRGDARNAATMAASTRAFEVLQGTTGLVGLYQPFGDEINPAGLVALLSGSGRRVGLPTTPKFGAPLVFRAWAPGDRLVRGRMNIPEPAPDAPEVFPQVLVVPPVAFDRRCYRIGYGAGFYDRTIPSLRAMHPVLALGFAFAVQEVDAVPNEPHDIPLDAIATDIELIRPGGA